MFSYLFHQEIKCHIYLAYNNSYYKSSKIIDCKKLKYEKIIPKYGHQLKPHSLLGLKALNF